LWKKAGGDVGATVDALAVSPVGHKLTPQLERALLAVHLVERQQILPIARLDGGPFNGPPEIPQLALLQPDLLAFSFSGFSLESLC